MNQSLGWFALFWCLSFSLINYKRDMVLLHLMLNEARGKCFFFCSSLNFNV